MATTTNYSWTTPDDTSLVKDGASAIRSLGTNVDTQVFNNWYLVTANAQTGTSYTLVLTDRGKMIELNNAAAITLTIPTNASVAFPTGTRIDLLQTGAGQVTISPAGGVTVNAKDSATKLSKQWSGASLVKRASDTWVLIGDISV